MLVSSLRRLNGSGALKSARTYFWGCHSPAAIMRCLVSEHSRLLEHVLAQQERIIKLQGEFIMSTQALEAAITQLNTDVATLVTLSAASVPQADVDAATAQITTLDASVQAAIAAATPAPAASAPAAPVAPAPATPAVS